jgi:acetylcholinesterase
MKILLSTLALAALAGAVAADTPAPVVDLGYSQYQGSWNATSNVTSFLGIRYAAPPTGTFDTTSCSLGNWNLNLTLQGH